jgi:GST-like protein
VRVVGRTQRHAGILDTRLAKSKSTCSADTYTIVDMNGWGWARLIPTVLGDATIEVPQAHRLFWS